MSDEAREAAAHFKRQVGEGFPVDAAFQVLVEAAVAKAHARGVAEGIWRAREAVVGVSFWEEADAVAVEDALDALDAIDNDAGVAEGIRQAREVPEHDHEFYDQCAICGVAAHDYYRSDPTI